MLTRNSFPRPDDLTDKADPAVLYVRSYLLIRTLVGLLGILLPVLFIVGEAAYFRGGVHVRGSLSAYYHTSMRDIFVAGLCVIGFLLATYLSGQVRTWDFWLSLVAGVAVVAVVFFPTSRPGLAPGDPRCGATPVPAGCSPVQQRLGESLVAGIHFACAVVFILSLAAIAFLFAYRARQYEHNRAVAAVQRVCGWVIIAAVVGAVVGELAAVRIWELTPLYLAEVASVWAFGTSWLLQGRALWTRLSRPRSRGLRRSRPRAGAAPVGREPGHGAADPRTGQGTAAVGLDPDPV